MKMTKKGNYKTDTRLLAIEILASSPGLNKNKLCKDLNIAPATLRTWMSDPIFIDNLYKRYMEVAGVELPLVVQSMIREAKEGNVQAGRLILEHFGKLDNRVKIQVESPFEKFMKMEEVQNGEFVEDNEVTNGAISIAEQASSLYDNDSDLPARNVLNDNPGKRNQDEAEKLKYATQVSKKKAVEKVLQKKYYARRKRAKDVNLELLKPGRMSKGKREEWWKELESLEIKKFGKIMGERS